MVLVATKGTKWVSKRIPSQYLQSDKCYKSETLGGVRGILQGHKKFQVDITGFAL